MPKRTVTMHELETTRWTVDLLGKATQEEIIQIRSYIAENNTAREGEIYNRFLTKLLENAPSMRTEL